MASFRFRTPLALAVALAFSLGVPFDVLARGASEYGGGRSRTSSFSKPCAAGRADLAEGRAIMGWSLVGKSEA